MFADVLGLIHKSAHSTGVSLDEAGVRWTCIPPQLPIHPTAITAIRPVARRNFFYRSSALGF